ncbi:MAG TPA: helix-turn-helix domain-containing protein [Bacteroidia bacterium]|nr:helix-turn-helix domain-containing protein [Bacteroidia bacterium]
MTLAQRIKILRKHLGLSQTEFANEIGITQTSLSQIEGEKNGISYDVFKGIIGKFRVSPAWLMDGEGEMLQTDEAARKGGALPLVVQVAGDEEENIVVVDKKAAAGYLQGQQDPDFIAKLPSFRLPGFYGKTYRAFEITGDSMLPGIHPGDMLIGSYTESLDHLRKGHIYIFVMHDGSIVAKRVSPLGENKFELISDNAGYDPYAVDAADIAQTWTVEARITKDLEKPGDDRISTLELRLKELEKKIN